MNIREQTPLRSRPDDIDALLRRFFRAEMPEPWPALKLPEPDLKPMPRPALRRWAMVRSRLALAASILLLLVGSWLLSGAFREVPLPSADPDGSNNTAIRRPILDKATTPGGRSVLIKGEEIEQGKGPDGKPKIEFKVKVFEEP